MLSLDARLLRPYKRSVLTARRALVLCLALVVPSGCTDVRTDAERTLQEIGPVEIRKDAALLYKEVFDDSGAGFRVVPAPTWPRSFQRLKPRRVGAYVDGFSLALQTDADTEKGLYIVPLNLERPVPSGAEGAKFKAIEEGIFWYEFAK